jgi:hypothetical protein
MRYTRKYKAYAKFEREILRRGDPLEDLDIDGMIILNWLLIGFI